MKEEPDLSSWRVIDDINPALLIPLLQSRAINTLARPTISSEEGVDTYLTTPIREKP